MNFNCQIWQSKVLYFDVSIVELGKSGLPGTDCVRRQCPHLPSTLRGSPSPKKISQEDDLEISGSWLELKYVLSKTRFESHSPPPASYGIIKFISCENEALKTLVEKKWRIEDFHTGRFSN